MLSHEYGEELAVTIPYIKLQNDNSGIGGEAALDKNKNKKILEIVCSPNLKHVAALHEDNDISLCFILSQESKEEFLTNVKTINIGNISINVKINTILDNSFN
ncbi:hypothetical protein C2G38_2158113 [Gigaspora rosea]|uniref:Uncharacterized protein n=1 Tax=Gigaspora rosea TaxID=44941 RepID=A0A397W2P8_9GLOM|nr:hypothetical protein C2G38_2158113 [Gigaspora rosea]